MSRLPVTCTTALLAAALLLATSVAALVTNYEDDKSARPGESVTYEIIVANDDIIPFDYRMETDENWSYHFYPEEFRLWPGENESILLTLNVPTTAVSGPHKTSVQILEKEAYNPAATWRVGHASSVVTNVQVPVQDSQGGGGHTLLWLGAATLAGAGILIYRWRRSLLGLLPVWLVSRFMVPPAELTLSQGRIMSTISEQPGLGMGTLLEHVTLSRSTIYYHLQNMEKQGLIYRGPQGGWFPRHHKGHALKPMQRRVLTEIRRNGPLSQRELARRLEVSQTTICYHLRKLEEIGALPGG